MFITTTIVFIIVRSMIFKVNPLIMSTCLLGMTFLMLHLGKYFQYMDADLEALLVQLATLYLGHYFIRNVLTCLGMDPDDYLSYSFPEVRVDKMLSYIFSTQKFELKSEPQDDSPEIKNLIKMLQESQAERKKIERQQKRCRGASIVSTRRATATTQEMVETML